MHIDVADARKEVERLDGELKRGQERLNALNQELADLARGMDRCLGARFGLLKMLSLAEQKEKENKTPAAEGAVIEGDFKKIE